MKTKFNLWLNEAISNNNANRAASLIASFLSKKTEKKFVRLGGVEEFSNSKASGYGIRYFYDGDKSIRFNWEDTGFSSANLSSIDVWEGTSHDPEYNISFDHEASLINVLPFVADVLSGPIKIGEFSAIPIDNLNEDHDDVFDKIIAELKPGEPVPVSMILSSLGYRGEKLLNHLRLAYGNMFEKQGRSLVFSGTDAEITELKNDKDKIMQAIGAVKVSVQKGGTNDTVTTPLPAGLPDTNQLEKVAYEDQLEDLKALIVLTVKGASNALFIAGRGGIGKALAHGTRVLTGGGYVPVESLSVGDFVIAQDGSEVKVSGVYPQGVRDVYQINFVDGRSAVVDKDHLWEINVEGVSKISTTDEIKSLIENKKLDRRITIPLFDPPDDKDVDLPIDPYLLGVLLGDGSLSQPYGIAFTTADNFILNEVTKRLPSTSVVKSLKGSDIDFGIVSSDSPGPGRKHALLESLRNLGLQGKKSDSKFIPEIYKNASTQQKKELIAGLIDTDGWVDNTIQFTTVSPKLAKDFQEIIWSLGGKAKTVKYKSSYKKNGIVVPCQDAYGVTVQYHSPHELMKLPRKIKRVRDDHQYSNVQLPILSIVEAGKAECTCIKIDHPRSLFVIDDYVCTHNTHTVESQLNHLGLRDGDGYFKQTGSASASGIYRLLFQHRKELVLFDDADGALADQDGRNLIKAATDTKKVRKLAWAKNAKNLVDAETITDEQIEAGMLPSNFEFTGRIIFISNLPIDKLDPDRALRTRALMISIDPSDLEIVDFMRKIVDKIELEDGQVLDHAEREEVVDMIQNGAHSDLNIRKLVRGLNIRASAKAGGISNWQRLIKFYS